MFQTTNQTTTGTPISISNDKSRRYTFPSGRGALPGTSRAKRMARFLQAVFCVPESLDIDIGVPVVVVWFLTHLGIDCWESPMKVASSLEVAGMKKMDFPGRSPHGEMFLVERAKKRPGHLVKDWTPDITHYPLVIFHSLRTWTWLEIVDFTYQKWVDLSSSCL